MDKKKEVIGIFLDTFAANGLADTTSRDLAKSLNLQSGGLYYYFESKDAAILACAEEAISRFDKIITEALCEIRCPETMIRNAQKRADELAPSIRFLTQVCTSPKYAPQLNADLEKLFSRCTRYSEQAAREFGCEHNEVAPFVHMGVSAAWQYMLFGKQAYISSQVDAMKAKLISLTQKNDCTESAEKQIITLMEQEGC